MSKDWGKLGRPAKLNWVKMPAQTWGPNRKEPTLPSLRAYWMAVAAVLMMRLSLIEICWFPLRLPDLLLDPYCRRKTAKTDCPIIVLLYTEAPATPRISTALSS